KSGSLFHPPLEGGSTNSERSGEFSGRGQRRRILDPSPKNPSDFSTLPQGEGLAQGTNSQCMFARPLYLLRDAVQQHDEAAFEDGGGIFGLGDFVLGRAGDEGSDQAGGAPGFVERKARGFQDAALAGEQRVVFGGMGDEERDGVRMGQRRRAPGSRGLAEPASPAEIGGRQRDLCADRGCDFGGEEMFARKVVV